MIPPPLISRTFFIFLSTLIGVDVLPECEVVEPDVGVTGGCGSVCTEQYTSI